MLLLLLLLLLGLLLLHVHGGARGSWKGKKMTCLRFEFLLAYFVFVCFWGALFSKDGQSISKSLCLHPLSIQNVL